MGKVKLKTRQNQKGQAQREALEDPGGEAGDNFPDDNLGYRDGIDPIFFDGLLDNAVKPHSPGSVIEGGEDGGHGDQAGNHENGIGNPLDIGWIYL